MASLHSTCAAAGLGISTCLHGGLCLDRCVTHQYKQMGLCISNSCQADAHGLPARQRAHLEGCQGALDAKGAQMASKLLLLGCKHVGTGKREAIQA